MIGKKVVSRNIAIGLGVVCIILIAGLGGYIASHHHSDSEYDTLQNHIKITDFIFHTPIDYLFDINKTRSSFTVMIENQGSTDVSGLNLVVKILAKRTIHGTIELGRDTSQLSTLSAGHQLTMDMSVLVDINATAGKTPTYVATIQLSNTTLDESTFTND